MCTFYLSFYKTSLVHLWCCSIWGKDGLHICWTMLSLMSTIFWGLVLDEWLGPSFWGTWAFGPWYVEGRLWQLNKVQTADFWMDHVPTELILIFQARWDYLFLCKMKPMIKGILSEKLWGRCLIQEIGLANLTTAAALGWSQRHRMTSESLAPMAKDLPMGKTLVYGVNFSCFPLICYYGHCSIETSVFEPGNL